MKIVQYILIFVFVGILSASITDGYIPVAYGSDNIARRNGVNVEPQILIPRIYIPSIPKGQKYLDHYSPDNYCSSFSIEDLSVEDIKQCFKMKKKWIRPTQWR